jgi:hypothetical protein
MLCECGEDVFEDEAGALDGAVGVLAAVKLGGSEVFVLR